LQRAKHLDLSAVYNKALLLRSLKQVDFLAKPAYAVIELISTVEISIILSGIVVMAKVLTSD
jgi:hypothetical protein